MSQSDNGSMKEAKYSTYDLRVRAVQALQDGMSVSQVAQAYRVDRATLYRWRVRLERAGGTDGLLRAPGSGRPRKLQGLTLEQWREIILQPASAFGFETDFLTAQRGPPGGTPPLGARGARPDHPRPPPGGRPPPPK